MGIDSASSGGVYPLHHGDHNSHGVPPTVNPVALSRGRDQPFFDPVAYGNGPDDSVTDTTEAAAITHHTILIDGKRIAYTATVGHLVTVDPSSSLPAAKIFYVAFTADGAKEETRPVTFFYNGGPGSSSVFVLLGSFAPKRIKTSMPGFTPPAPYQIEDNPDSMIDHSDLVFINPVGTGYSAAVAPNKNRNFWGVDQDADSLKQFIKRYLTKNNRWNSPKYLFGESYGTARSCVLAYKLHEDGVDLNGVTLQSSILDYRQAGNPVGALPTAAADAWYHKKLGVTPAAGRLMTADDERLDPPVAVIGYGYWQRRFGGSRDAIANHIIALDPQRHPGSGLGPGPGRGPGPGLRRKNSNVSWKFPPTVDGISNMTACTGQF